jgi:hypothetical protein
MDGVGFEVAIEWFVSCVYDRVEVRFGRVAAFIVSFLLAVSILGLIVAIAWYFLWR